MKKSHSFILQILTAKLQLTHDFRVVVGKELVSQLEKATGTPE